MLYFSSLSQFVKLIIRYGEVEERECWISLDILFICIKSKIVDMVGPRELEKLSLTLFIKKRMKTFSETSTP